MFLQLVSDRLIFVTEDVSKVFLSLFFQTYVLFIIILLTEKKSSSKDGAHDSNSQIKKYNEEKHVVL